MRSSTNRLEAERRVRWYCCVPVHHTVVLYTTVPAIGGISTFFFYTFRRLRGEEEIQRLLLDPALCVATAVAGVGAPSNVNKVSQSVTAAVCCQSLGRMASLRMKRTVAFSCTFWYTSYVHGGVFFFLLLFASLEFSSAPFFALPLK